MKAVNGYLEDGRFTPLEITNLPKRVKAILVFNDLADVDDREERLSWLNRFHSAVKQSADEDMPDFPRVRFDRMPVDLSDEV
jgi:hypothetical protein